MNTYLTYMEQPHLLQDSATIIDITTYNGKDAIILDKTIFYPQGGGQPYDQGTIKNNATVFDVQEVRFKNGIVYHIGEFKNGTFEKDTNVTLEVDKDRRLFNSRNHTAGHIVDIAIRNMGITLPPYRGYHFPEGAYVEYAGTIDEEERTTLLPKLQKEVDTLIAKNIPVHIRMATLEELKEIARLVPDFIPKDKPTRAMILEGFPAIPCGGTHAKNTKDVGPITIEKIRNKKGNLRVSYSIHN